MVWTIHYRHFDAYSDLFLVVSDFKTNEKIAVEIFKQSSGLIIKLYVLQCLCVFTTGQ